MHKLIRIVLAVAVVFPLLFSLNVHADAASEPYVTVKLQNYIGNKEFLKVNVTGQYKTGNSKNDELLKGLSSFTLKVENGKLVVYDNTKKIGIVEGNLVLNPTNMTSDNVQIVGNTSRRYHGSFEFKVESSKYVRPYNKVLLEEYVKGVVPREMPASWHTEALKAQSIAARTYVTSHKYNVNDTQGNQVYGGIEETVYKQKISDIVENTRGKVLKIGNSLASTLFTSSNGGHTESNGGAWGYTSLSYLPAKVDSYDPIHRWDVQLQENQISLLGLDLKNPEKWWSSVKEVNSIAQSNMKTWLKGQLSLPTATDIKILSIEELTIHPERTTGKRIKTGAVKIKYIEKSSSGYIKDSNGNIQIKTYQHSKLTGNQIRSMLGTLNMKSLLVDTIESPTSTIINRVSGSDRIATSIAVSKQLYPNGFPANHSNKTVFIATSNEFADALSAGPLANQYGNAPILLTAASSLSSQVEAEIKRLKATNVSILGGKTAVSDAVANQLNKISSVNTVNRISGPTRFETNAEINKKLTNIQGTFVASGQNFADALSGSSVAAINNYAVVLTDKNTLPKESQAFVSTHKSKPIYILGGSNAVSDNVFNQIRTMRSNTERLSGVDRYETMAKILTEFKGSFSGTSVIYSTGEDFPDALASSSLAAAKQAPLVLVGGGISNTLSNFLTSYKPSVKEINVLGGTGAVSESKVNQLKDKLGVITTLRLSGTGFGHGVGMSQYGAQAQASAGRSYSEILYYYYPGTYLASGY
ncbi:SpoIID/LytB domain protein [Metabacillus crassostreae]|uniref:cell wall-binding repeat-containing protein n=1 Tax=Metabacillus crassostreae TaxID=929098 RepID=UPI00195AFE6E|nr:cell wall-binding repeat-containing protein [Metabacillus crassostreae]MBM7606371.1 SpoIID/LytB domain protein [Metabacillus crassostreae]